MFSAIEATPWEVWRGVCCKKKKKAHNCEILESVIPRLFNRDPDNLSCSQFYSNKKYQVDQVLSLSLSESFFPHLPNKHLNYLVPKISSDFNHLGLCT